MFSKRGTLAVACLATAMLMLDIAVVNTALPRIATDLRSGLDGLQWIVDAYTLALATVVLTVGSLADRLGRRRLFAAGTVIFTGASLACALAGSITALDAARAVQGRFAPALPHTEDPRTLGVGSGFFRCPETSWEPPERRGHPTVGARVGHGSRAGCLLPAGQPLPFPGRRVIAGLPGAGITRRYLRDARRQHR